MSANPQHAQSQESEDGVDSTLGPLQQEPDSLLDDDTDAVWQSFNILSLDGGGIRGYWSLLALERLMDFVSEAEEDLDRWTYHSFHPEPWPDDVSQLPLTEEQRTRITDADNEVDKARLLPRARRYLPCHYFDNICGSSTGALIAIMLGRFRMTVPDCIHEYRSLGQMVFGKPRFFTAINFGLGNRYKYKAARLEKVFKDVTKRRNEKPDGDHFGKITFPSKRGLCTTFVTTKKSSQPNGASATLYLIRSYDHERKRTPDQSTTPTPRTTMGSSRANTGMSANPGTGRRGRGEGGLERKNYEKAQEFEIWQVARAATAAPFYFEPLKIEKARAPGSILFTDGGFSYDNNPSRESKREIQDLHGHNRTHILVSVGTARKKREEKKSFFNKVPREIRGMADDLTNPEKVHEDVERDQRSEGFHYYRLNHPDGLDIELDRWEPKQHWFNQDAGSDTINTMRNHFAHWACQLDTIQLLRDCAAMLVECRRRRKLTDKWERYATAAQYLCHYKGCDHEDFFSGIRFAAHLRQHHHIPEDSLQEEVDRRKHQWRYQDDSVPHAH